jgi:hypothetical protein
MNQVLEYLNLFDHPSGGTFALPPGEETVSRLGGMSGNDPSSSSSLDLVRPLQ